MDKVLTTTEFVLKQFDVPFDLSQGDKSAIALRIEKYATLMLQSLELGMFVPCLDGNPIEEPEKIMKLQHLFHSNHIIELGDKQTTVAAYKKQYKEAKEQVLFEFELSEYPHLTIGNRMTLHFEKDDRVAWYEGHTKINSMWLHENKLEDLARQIDLKPTKAFLNKIEL